MKVRFQPIGAVCNAANAVLRIEALIAAKLPLVSRYDKMLGLHANTFASWMN